mgnify:CR=1 FL=1
MWQWQCLSVTAIITAASAWAGTEKEIFNYVINPQRGKWLQINEGRAFEAPFEAVLGARMAAMTGLKVGDNFKTSHGMVEIPGSKGMRRNIK